jgi:hypothetical protein
LIYGGPAVTLGALLYRLGGPTPGAARALSP